MGEYKCLLTHKDRFFVNNKVSSSVVHKELLATCDQWLEWFVLNKSFNTIVHQESYAQILKEGKLLKKSQDCTHTQGQATITNGFH